MPRRDRRDLLFDKHHAAARSIDETVLIEDARPVLDGDLQEIERDPPVVIELRQSQRIERRKAYALDDQFIDETGETAGKCEGIQRRGADEAGLVRIGCARAVAIH